MMAKADLHMHSTASDGRLPPVDVVKMAAENNLSAIALTDHDTFAGYNEAVAKADELGVELISGIEITTLFRDREIHLLAYGFSVEDKEMNELTLKHKKARLQRAYAIINLLASKGIEIDMNEVIAETDPNQKLNIGRPHIAKVLVRKQMVSSVKEAFIRYLSDDNIGQITPDYEPVERTMEIVKHAGGVVSLAHPSDFFETDELHDLVEIGLDGIEYIHPSHDYGRQCYYEKFCDDHYLLKTGGSDFHGYGNDEQNLGIIAISLKYVQTLKNMIETRNSVNTTL